MSDIKAMVDRMTTPHTKQRPESGKKSTRIPIPSLPLAELRDGTAVIAMTDRPDPPREFLYDEGKLLTTQGASGRLDTKEQPLSNGSRNQGSYSHRSRITSNSKVRRHLKVEPEVERMKLYCQIEKQLNALPRAEGTLRQLSDRSGGSHQYEGNSSRLVPGAGSFRSKIQHPSLKIFRQMHYSPREAAMVKPKIPAAYQLNVRPSLQRADVKPAMKARMRSDQIGTVVNMLSMKSPSPGSPFWQESPEPEDEIFES
jgi:hypothetical protein